MTRTATAEPGKRVTTNLGPDAARKLVFVARHRGQSVAAVVADEFGKRIDDLYRKAVRETAAGVKP